MGNSDETLCHFWFALLCFALLSLILFYFWMIVLPSMFVFQLTGFGIVSQFLLVIAR